MLLEPCVEPFVSIIERIFDRMSEGRVDPRRLPDGSEADFAESNSAPVGPEIITPVRVSWISFVMR